MSLSRPTFAVFVISFILGLLALFVQYGGVNVPIVSGHSTAVMALAYILLVAGVTLPGL